MPEVPSKIYGKVRLDDRRGAYLDDCALSSDFKDLTLSTGSVSEFDVDDLSVSIDFSNTLFGKRMNACF